jgi:SHS2 domain-containing protein
VSNPNYKSAFSPPGYTILEHPADIGIEARGSSLKEAFQNAALGLVSIILDPSDIQQRETRSVTLAAADCEQLLVRWLSEILYLYDAQQFVGKEFIISQLTETDLSAIVVGERLSRDKHMTRQDVKAITYHQLLVDENAKGGLVRVFVDV